MIWIGSDSLLRTDDEIVREAMDVLGFRRRGSRIDQALRLAVSRTRRLRRG